MFVHSLNMFKEFSYRATEQKETKCETNTDQIWNQFGRLEVEYEIAIYISYFWSVIAYTSSQSLVLVLDFV